MSLLALLGDAMKERGLAPGACWKLQASVSTSKGANAVACQLQTIVSWVGSRRCMMLGMHPWIGLSNDVRGLVCSPSG